jgi:hypothetical protein
MKLDPRGTPPQTQEQIYSDDSMFLNKQYS